RAAPTPPVSPYTTLFRSIGARTSGGDNSQSLGSSGYVLTFAYDGSWELQRRGTVVESGELAGAGDGWHALTLEVAGDEITAEIDGEELATWTDPTPIRSGWVDLASGFHHTQFDNLLIERVDGFIPY